MEDADWILVEEWRSDYGVVRKEEDGSWTARVYVKAGKAFTLVKVKGEYESAAVAKGVVERVWKREQERRKS